VLNRGYELAKSKAGADVGLTVAIVTPPLPMAAAVAWAPRRRDANR